MTAQQGIKIVLQIVLLVTFLAFFGVPALKKYQLGEVMVVETSRNTDGTVPTWVPFCGFGSPLGLLFCSKVPFFSILD